MAAPAILEPPQSTTLCLCIHKKAQNTDVANILLYYNYVKHNTKHSLLKEAVNLNISKNNNWTTKCQKIKEFIEQSSTPNMLDFSNRKSIKNSALKSGT